MSISNGSMIFTIAIKNWGILTEAITSIETGLVTDVIIGVGLNLAISTFPDELESKAGSLFEGLVPSPAMTSSARFGENFFIRISMNWSTSTKSAPLVLGRTVTFEQNQQTYQGLAKDISDTGQLLVQLENQEDIWLNSGEISLKQWNL